ncbi:MAG: hypothetical protein ACYS7Y_04250 [Planctomycetota bacterium]|jgi:hypothetical protein
MSTVKRMREQIAKIEEGGPNLDAMDGDELVEFAMILDDYPVAAAAKMFDMAPDRMKARHKLVQYAWHRVQAIGYRLEGNILDAQRYEAICETIYENLPEIATW